MFLSNQTTLRQKVTFNGIGLHTGESTTVIVHPAAENTGINFIINGTIIPALIGFVSKTSYATQLHQGDVSIKTVEHLLSAFMGLGLTNALCEVIGPEIPIMDGSSWPFYFALKSVGLLHQKEPLKIAVVNKTVEVCYGESVGILSPSQDQSFEITLAYDHPFIKDNALSLRFSFSKNDYPTDIARARTYGFKKDIEFYKKNKLARGADLTNSLVFDDHAILNPDGLRFYNEVARHKMLDAIGDMSLIGGAFWGHYKAIKPGHTLNIKLIMEAFLQNAFDWVDADVLMKNSHNALI